MYYNNYPYYNNPYNNQPNYNQPVQPIQPQIQTQYIPLTFVNGIEGAKTFIVAPNQTVYLRDSDSDSNLLFIKQADSQGKYTLTAYELTPVQDKPKNAPQYAQISDLQALNNKVDTLYQKVESLLVGGEKHE